VLDRLFVEAESLAAAATQPATAPTPAAANDQKLPEAPLEMRLRWIQEVADIGPDALELFEQQTLQEWDRASLVAVPRAIDARRRELASY